LDILLVAVVLIDGDVAVVVLQDISGLVAEGIPDTGAAPVLAGRPFHLIGGSGTGEQEIGGESQVAHR
jgi:hypothetical protein